MDPKGQERFLRALDITQLSHVAVIAREHECGLKSSLRRASQPFKVIPSGTPRLQEHEALPGVRAR